MRCPVCHQAIEAKNAWRAAQGRFYCSEFCADSATTAPFQPVSKTQMDRQYIERLERLLPLRLSMSAHTISR